MKSCKNSESSAVSAMSSGCFVRQRFVKKASSDRGTPSKACHDASWWLQTSYHMCLSVPRTVLETRSLLALCDESSTVLSPCAVLRQSVSCCAVSLPFCVTSD